MYSKCMICGKKESDLGNKISIKNIGNHIHIQHKISSKEYYDRFFKKEGEGFCRVCGKPTKFRSFAVGYEKCCCKSCARSNQWKTSPEYREMMKKVASETMTKTNNEILWKDDGFKERKSEHMKDLNGIQWEDEEFRNKMAIIKSEEMRLNRQDPEFNRKNREACQTPEFREIHSKIAIQRHIDNPDGFGECKYKTGYYYSEKNQCELYYASSYELKAFEMFEKMDEVKSFGRCRFSIEYINPVDNKVHRYIPDIEVIYSDGNKQIIEMKGENKLEDEVVLAKARAAKEMFNEDYQLWTFDDLE